MAQLSRDLNGNPIRRALERCKPHFVAAAIFSAVSNVLALVPSIYMMQVYDRVIPTGGLMTLLVLSAVGLMGLMTMSLLDWLRSRLLFRAGARLDALLAGETLSLVLSRPRLNGLARSEAMRNLDTLRSGISSTAASALFDIPWAPIYVIVAFLLHPALGALVLGAAILVLALAWHNERALRAPVQLAGSAAAATYSRQAQLSANAGEVRALGMVQALAIRQLEDRAGVNELQRTASFSGGNHSGLSRFLRLVLQSAALGVGALLVVEGKLSGGAVFASSLLLGRALAPIELVVASWKPILQTRAAYIGLSQLFGDQPAPEHTRLPAPVGSIQVQNLTMLAPESDRVAIADIGFAIEPGQIVGLVGPSGAGKSTLLRALAGADLPARGHVRFDGASTADWDAELLARHIGYLPQNFILFPGTVKDNIVRFRRPDAEVSAAELDAAAIEAARTIGAHELILQMPQGYDTFIGHGGTGLSAGQAQRIAIARALFGDPRILLLDEPTAHLDVEAHRAFGQMLARQREAGHTVVFSAHSADLLGNADKLLLLRDGRIERFSPISEFADPRRPHIVHAAQKVAS
jgi:PrtD family type I secretion system ABC transporter